MEEFLYDTDLISSTHSVVRSVFSGWSWHFLELIKEFSEGRGAGILGSDLADGLHLTSGGVLLESHGAVRAFDRNCESDDDVTITYDDLYYYMDLASQRYVANHPADKAEIEQCLKAFRDSFLTDSK
ncbi:hypothetical protein IJT17_07410 [bacterium]|nr:hypothetical protein [bacterium]